jgi:undecaprenyl-diphosphatase
MATRHAEDAGVWTNRDALASGSMRTTAASDARSDLRPWIAIAIVGLAGFAAVTALVAAGVPFPFDRPILDALKGLGQYMEAWEDISTSANLPLIAVGVAIVAWLVWRHHVHEAIIVVAVLAVITAGSELVKQLVARPRPPGFANGELGVVYSYPSGHVLESVAIFGIIAVLVWRSSLPKAIRLIVPLVFSVIVGFVAVARVAVGAHYPSDVLGGFLAGIGFLALFVIATELLRRHDEAKQDRGDDHPARPDPHA